MLFSLITLVLSGVILFYVVLPKIKEKQNQKKLERWNKTPKDVVIMHAVKRAATVSHPSPFVVKLETFLRMAKIKYEADLSLTDAWGPKGRFPWISLNGHHMGDSQLIIEFLKKKFDVKLGDSYTKEDKAKGAIIRIMMDDHFFWAIPMYRFVYGSFEQIKKLMGPKVAAYRVFLFQTYAGWAFNRRSKGHGIGLHTRKEIEELTMSDLTYLSDVLGSKKYILGDSPSEYDCTVFGHLSQAMWGLPGSIYETAIQGGKYPNLKSYCERMRDTFYPDWESILEK